ncbi:MAG: hypothetical protein ABSF26_15550 [Thermoguttaceae bacterium]|jgi:hypothetical protein
MPELANGNEVRGASGWLERQAERLFYLFLVPLGISLALHLLVLLVAFVCLLPFALAAVLSLRPIPVDGWYLVPFLAYFPMAGIGIWLARAITQAMSRVRSPNARFLLGVGYGVLHTMTWHRTLLPLAQVFSRQVLDVVVGLIGIVAAAVAIAVGVAFCDALPRDAPTTDQTQRT